MTGTTSPGLVPTAGDLRRPAVEVAFDEDTPVAVADAVTAIQEGGEFYIDPARNPAVGHEWDEDGAASYLRENWDQFCDEPDPVQAAALEMIHSNGQWWKPTRSTAEWLASVAQGYAREMITAEVLYAEHVTVDWDSEASTWDVGVLWDGCCDGRGSAIGYQCGGCGSYVEADMVVEVPNSEVAHCPPGDRAEAITLAAKAQLLEAAWEHDNTVVEDLGATCREELNGLEGNGWRVTVVHFPDGGVHVSPTRNGRFEPYDEYNDDYYPDPCDAAKGWTFDLGAEDRVDIAAFAPGRVSAGSISASVPVPDEMLDHVNAVIITDSDIEALVPDVSDERDLFIEYFNNWAVDKGHVVGDSGAARRFAIKPLAQLVEMCLAE